MVWYNILKSMFGVKTADRMTNYQFWTIPPAEDVDPPRIRTQVVPNGPIVWEPAITDQYVINYRGKPQTDGVMTGTPMQWGLIEKFRSVTWGWAKYGEIGARDLKFKAKIPNPKTGWYWITGTPLPMYDRGAIIREPHQTKRVFHELVQFDPNQVENYISNQALTWGKFEDGVLVAGRHSSATNTPIHPYVWTPTSKDNPHRTSIVVDNYKGADGDLNPDGPGVIAGSIVMLDPSSPSYKEMIALGGECAAIAEAAATMGCVVADRIMGDHTVAKYPAMRIQPGAQWAKTNINQLKIRQVDFIYAKEK